MKPSILFSLLALLLLVSCRKEGSSGSKPTLKYEVLFSKSMATGDDITISYTDGTGQPQTVKTVSGTRWSQSVTVTSGTRPFPVALVAWGAKGDGTVVDVTANLYVGGEKKATKTAPGYAEVSYQVP